MEFQGVLRGVPVYVGEGKHRCWRSRGCEPGPSSERAVILAPKGRDASVAAALIREAGYHANICADLAALVHEIESGAGSAVIADEAIKTADLRGLVELAEQSAVLVGFSDRAADASGRRSRAQSGRSPARPDAGQRTFIERPFHPTTLVSVVGSAVRGRRRQYQSRRFRRISPKAKACCRPR